MKFDVIIGNPPYQLSVGGPTGSARAIYHLFVEKAIELSPRYITMIIPSRWMSGSAKGIPNKWVDTMIVDKRMKEMHDFVNSEDCFDGVMIRGGVNYFLWDRDYAGKCSFHQHNKGEVLSSNEYLNSRESGIVVRDINALPIIDKIINIEGNYLKSRSDNFSSMVSTAGFFSSDNKLTGRWNDYSKEETDIYNIKYYTSAFLTGSSTGWVKDSDIGKNKESININKIYINQAGDNTKFGRVIAVPRFGESNSVCSQTYVVIGYDAKKHNFTKEEIFNIMSYIRTKFFRFMVDIKKITQHCSRDAYQFVPLQDFSKPWTDEELYKKYKLTQEEIDYIEENIDPMPTSDD